MDKDSLYKLLPDAVKQSGNCLSKKYLFMNRADVTHRNRICPLLMRMPAYRRSACRAYRLWCTTACYVVFQSAGSRAL